MTFARGLPGADRHRHRRAGNRHQRTAAGNQLRPAGSARDLCPPHRRTGRAGRDGQAIAFCSEEERPLLKDILKLTGLELDPDSGELAPAQNSRKKPAGKKPDTAQTGGQKQAEEKRAAQNSPHKVRPDRGRAGANRRDRLPATRNRRGNEPAASRPRTGNSRRTRTPRHARHDAVTATGAGKSRMGKTQRPQTRDGDRMGANPEALNPPGTNGKREAPRLPEKPRRRRRKSPAWATGCPASSGRAASNHRATCPPCHTTWKSRSNAPAFHIFAPRGSPPSPYLDRFTTTGGCKGTKFRGFRIGVRSMIGAFPVRFTASQATNVS